MTMNDAQESARLASTEDQIIHNDDHSVDSDGNQNEANKEMTCNFYTVEHHSPQRTATLQAMRHLCTKYNVKELADVVETQAIKEDRFSSVTTASQLTDQRADTKKKSLTH